MTILEYIKNICKTKPGVIRPLGDLFDHTRASIPADLNHAASRISYNTRYYSSNYALVAMIPVFYAFILDFQLLAILGTFLGVFFLINKYTSNPLRVDDRVVTQKWLYIWLFVEGIRVLYWTSTVDRIIFSFALVILSHATFMEPSRPRESGVQPRVPLQTEPRPKLSESFSE